MIQSINIENFRCFKKQRIDDLRRINIIVGPNAAGKTVFLESIFLAASSSPESAFKLRIWRGLAGEIQLKLDRASYESLWEDLFYEFDQKRTIRISLEGTHEKQRTLIIRYKQESRLPLDMPPQPIDSMAIVPIEFEWLRGSESIFRAEPALSEKGLSFPSGTVSFETSFFTAWTKLGPGSEPAAKFSALSKRNQEKLIIETLRKDYPFIENLSIEISGRAPIIFAKINSIEQKLAIALVSQGITQLLNYLVAIANAPNGVILIDEIETGFYYKKVESMWSSIFDFSKTYNTQIFVSTHSSECLRFLSPILEKNEEEFCFLQAQKIDGQCTIRRVASHDLLSALEEEVEVR